jgi:hypothetical protein
MRDVEPVVASAGGEMGSTTRMLLVGALMVGFGLGRLSLGDRAVSAQAPAKPFMMQRVYTGTDGLSHVEHIELTAKTFMEKVTGVTVNVSAPGSFSDYHVAPERRYIVNLTGGGRLQLADGTVDLPAGSVEYIDDLTGRGHTTANVSREPRVSLWLRFADQRHVIGPIGNR